MEVYDLTMNQHSIQYSQTYTSIKAKIYDNKHLLQDLKK